MGGDQDFSCTSWRIPSCAEARAGTPRYWAPEKTDTSTNGVSSQQIPRLPRGVCSLDLLNSAYMREGVGAYGIAMEVASENLHKAIYPKKLSETQVALFAAGVFFGLRDMHAKGVLHCDLKPGNV